MTLSDIAILESLKSRNIIIKPFIKENLQPNTYDVTLGSSFAIPVFTGKTYDISKEELPFKEHIGPITLKQGEFCLGVTNEYIHINSRQLMCILEGNSGNGRKGFTNHVTAGVIDTGFKGFITLEIVNFNPNPLILIPNMIIGQLRFVCTTIASCGYLNTSGYMNKECKPILPKLAKISKIFNTI